MGRGRDHDDRRVGDRRDLGKHLDAIHFRHLDITQDGIIFLLLHQPETLRPFRSVVHGVLLIFQDLPERVTDAFFVVDDKDSGHFLKITDDG